MSQDQCQKHLRQQGKAYPRTCQECGLGSHCRYYTEPEIVNVLEPRTDMTDNDTQAFPLPFTVGPNDDLYPASPGMTLRDYFAAHALNEAVSDYGRVDRGNPITPYAAQATGTREEIIARQAYRYADAMIKTRK